MMLQLTYTIGLNAEALEVYSEIFNRQAAILIMSTK
jgi:hypothetical protein